MTRRRQGKELHNNSNNNKCPLLVRILTHKLCESLSILACLDCSLLLRLAAAATFAGHSQKFCPSYNQIVFVRVNSCLDEPRRRRRRVISFSVVALGVQFNFHFGSSSELSSTALNLHLPDERYLLPAVGCCWCCANQVSTTIAITMDCGKRRRRRRWWLFIDEMSPPIQPRLKLRSLEQGKLIVVGHCRRLGPMTDNEFNLIIIINYRRHTHNIQTCRLVDVVE